MNTFIKNKEFRWITLSDWISVFGDSIFYLAFISFATTLEDSTLAISFMTFFEMLPDMLSFIFGYLCDKTKKKYTADIRCAFLRALLYFIVAILFMISKNWFLLYSVLFLNLLSDILGNYSDNLRFPEIYAIVPKEEYETSTGFSMGIYYSIKICSKMLGGITLILLNYNYIHFALINAFTFILCGLFLLKVKKKVEEKMLIYEYTNTNNNKSSFFTELKKILNNKFVLDIIIVFILCKSIIGILLPLEYMNLASDKSINTETYTLTISILNIIPTLGIISGNILGGIIFKRIKIIFYIIFEMFFVSIIIFLIILGISGKLLFLVYLFIFLLYGILAVKFNGFLFSNHEYNTIGLSVGITNTLLTLCSSLFSTFILFITNIFDYKVALKIVFIFSTFTLIYIFIKQKHYKNIL